MRGDLDVRVHAFGEPRDEDGTTGHPDLGELTGANAALTTLGVDLSLAAACEGADLVHSHTWYANFAGHLASLMGDIRHVLTAHSSSRCGRGRPSSSAAATASRPGSRRPPTRPPTPSSR